MKQILQSLDSGETHIVELPVPAVGAGELLIRSQQSLLSAGTERMLVDFGRAGWLEKARQQPEKVRMVRDKVRTDGLMPTIDTIRAKLDQPIPLGYSNVGVVEEVGDGVSGFEVGDRVVSNGCHAELVAVPVNLCAKIPQNVANEQATFTVIGSIALQGVRLAKPTLGECFVVVGLGLIGLMAVQLLRANGCRVLGLDLDESRLARAQEMGADVLGSSSEAEILAAAEKFSRGRGVDGVLLTLASKNSEPVSHAARMCRKRGRVILVGVTGLQLNRADFYEKEISFQVSCSYGPGRYDPDYEEQGKDYPIGFVRWTEQRNFEAVLDMMACGKLQTEPLITHRFAFSDAAKAYDMLVSKEPSMGILLAYESERDVASGVQRSVELPVQPHKAAATAASPKVAFIGAGNYAGRILMPAFSKAGTRFSTVVTGSGIGAAHYGKKYGFGLASTDVDVVMNGDDDVVVIATRHDSHADLVIRALESNKHVFVEKPLSLTLAELDAIEAAYQKAQDCLLMVGFNRRFAPQIVKMRELLQPMTQAKSFVMTVNAGAIPRDHWTQDPAVGGGRIVGEACHFVDLLRCLAGCEVDDWQVVSMSKSAQGDDCATLNLSFVDGSFGAIHYLANGDKSLPKERLEVFCGGRVLQLVNYRKLIGYGWPNFSRMNMWRQDKGQNACAKAFVQAVSQGNEAPIPFEELLQVSRLSIQMAEASRLGWASSS